MEIAKTKIIIAEDHDFYRRGLKAVLNEIGLLQIIGEAKNGQELIEILKSKNTDIIITDLKMPLLDGIEATKYIKSNFPNIKILILSMHGEEEYLKKMLELGVDGFILKNTEKDGLERAIKSIINNKQYFSEDFLPYFTNKYISRENNDEKIELTKRELEILQYISDGYTNKEIAAKLYLSVKTVINHRTNILSKTGSKNTASLIKYALLNNLIKFK